MILKIVSTGSSGNAYLLENSKESILIECGVSISKIKQSLNFNISKLIGCIVTHEHNDHAKYIYQLQHMGIKVYATQGTFDALKVENLNIVPIKNKTFKIGNFKIKPFDVMHDAKEPVGFLINHKETGNILFLTDSYYCKYTFPKLNNIIIESNYSEEIIKSKLNDKPFLRDRIYQSHMSLETCLQFLEANDLSSVNKIVLIHLSDSNSNTEKFKKTITKHTAKEVIIAENNMEIELNKTPF